MTKKSKIKVNFDTSLIRKKDQLFSEIDGEVVMLNVENSEYYGMDKVASHIWELLEKQITFQELISRLTDEYEVSESECKEDTLAFLEQLKDKNLIEIIPNKT